MSQGKGNVKTSGVEKRELWSFEVEENKGKNSTA